MELLINGKSLIEWTVSELEAIIGNSDFQENDYIDYKLCFAFMESKGDERLKKIAEFKHDVCSLANAGGGYLFFGIPETKGIPQRIVGINVPNADTDKFEQDIRNKLMGIQPAIPTAAIKHIPVIDNRFVVVIRIHEGVHAPYVYKESEAQYKFFVRRGNGKKEMSYNKIRNAFMYSLSHDEIVRRFRDSRHSLYLGRLGEGKRFVLFHIIPEDIANNTPHRKLFMMMREEDYRFSYDFPRSCSGSCWPNVDGVVYRQTDYQSGMEVQFYDNGTSELFLDIGNQALLFSGPLSRNSDETMVYAGSLFYNIKEFINGFIKARKHLSMCKRFYLCFSVFGCAGCFSDYNEIMQYTSRIDRNAIINTQMIGKW